MSQEVLDEKVMLEEKFEEAAGLFKALAHPLRLKLVCGLIRHPSTQTTISRLLDIPQSSLAQHLAVLRREGIVAGRRERGTEVILHVTDPRIPRIFREVCGGEDNYLKFDWEDEASDTEVKFPCIES